MELEGKIALVTGADSGIGRAIALTFAREGADIAVHFHSDERGAQQTAHAIQHHGRRVEVFQDDFIETETAERLIADVVTRFGHLDILVNNAGMSENAESSLEMTTDSFVR